MSAICLEHETLWSEAVLVFHVEGPESMLAQTVTKCSNGTWSNRKESTRESGSYVCMWPRPLLNDRSALTFYLPCRFSTQHNTLLNPERAAMQPIKLLEQNSKSIYTALPNPLAGGTGLGLSICQSLTTRMGGRIWVESEVDRGSSFLFTVRLGVPPARSPSDPVRVPGWSYFSLPCIQGSSLPAWQFCPDIPSPSRLGADERSFSLCPLICYIHC